MEAEYSSEMLVSIYCTTRCHVLHNNNLKADSCINQKTYNYLYFQKSTSLIEYSCRSPPVVSSTQSQSTDLEQILFSQLQCPVCTQYTRLPTILYANGHSICNICQQKDPHCPTCRQQFLNTRNVAIEKLGG